MVLPSCLDFFFPSPKRLYFGQWDDLLGEALWAVSFISFFPLIEGTQTALPRFPPLNVLLVPFRESVVFS